IDQKTQLVDIILNSLNPGRKEIDELWAREAERRVEEIKLGKVKTIPGEQVLKEVQKRLLK
ncbi:MAG: addiction module protein, partial [Candidatus Marinimicrobia bacterium]|nr:addiction module protein [bacterium]MCG2716427.1 addiction module protein [Candidatus Neomarinimicrobiota bacterium]